MHVLITIITIIILIIGIIMIRIVNAVFSYFIMSVLAFIFNKKKKQPCEKAINVSVRRESDTLT